MLFMQATAGGRVPRRQPRARTIRHARFLRDVHERVMRMAVEGRINVRHEDVFSQPVLLLSVDPVEDFDRKRAGDVDPQDRDKTTGLRLWSVSVLDPTAPQGKR